MLKKILQLLAIFTCLLAGNFSWAQSAPNWSSIGPAGGSLTTLLADPTAPTTALYAGSRANGVFFSANSGVTWSTASSGLPAGSQIFALASLGNLVYAATDSGVFVSSAAAAPSWQQVPSTGFTSTGIIKLLTSVNSTLYMAVPGESNVYTHSAADINRYWNPTTLPNGAAVWSLGVMGGDIAVGSDSAIFLADRITAPGITWQDSEFGVMSSFYGEPVVAIVSSSSTLAFACTSAGNVLQGNLTAGLFTVTWHPLTISLPNPFNCNGLAVARVNLKSTSVLTMSTDTGAFVSNEFDNSLPQQLPVLTAAGQIFPMTTSVNAAIQLNPADPSSMLWGTEFGLDSSGIDIFNMPSVSKRNGPSSLATPSQRLDNVNVKDFAIVGASWYAIAQSLSGMYMDVMVSNDKGASWSQTNLTSLTLIQNISVLVADTVRNVLYAGTDQGVYAYTQSAGWTLVSPDANSVNALAIGSNVLYVGRDAISDLDGSSQVSLLALNLDWMINGKASRSINNLPTNISVRSLVIAGGSVYAAGTMRDPVTRSYDNKVYFAVDNVTASSVGLPSWSLFGDVKSMLPNTTALTQLAVGAGKVFAGGDGFLWQCDGVSGFWTAMKLPSVPNSSPPESESVNALVSDGSVLYVGVSHGLLAVNLVDSTKPLVLITGAGSGALSSMLVNGLRVLGGRLYVATGAGVSTPVAAVTDSSGSGSGSGGGCSMSTAGEPDPLLWLLIGIAALQIAYARRRRGMRATSFRPDSHNKSKDR